MYRTSNTTQKTARAKMKTPYIKNASWLVIISGNNVFGSAELSGVDSGSGLVDSGSGAMVDALEAIKRRCAIVFTPICQNSLWTYVGTNFAVTLWFFETGCGSNSYVVFVYSKQATLSIFW